MTDPRTGPAQVAIGIPAWRASAFVGETLASLTAQTHRDWSALISVDGADDETAAACAPFLHDSRIRLVVQERRLGWVGNCNAVLAAAGDGDYAMILPHDDVLDPRYLAVLTAHATAYPEAACTYCDIGIAGQPPLVQPSVCGPPLVRQVTLLAGHFPAVAFRGLVRRAALATVGGPRENEADDFAADTAWMARLARAGDLLRVPGVYYAKRLHPASTHAAWQRWDGARQRRAWLVHCREMLAEALACVTDPAGRWMLVALAVARLTGAFPLAGSFAWLAQLDAPARTALAEEFLTAVWAGTDLGAETGLSAQAAAQHLAVPWPPARTLASELARVQADLARAAADLERSALEQARHAADTRRLRDELTAMSQANAGLTDAVARLEEHLADQIAARQRLEQDVARLRASTSWRVTAPLRALGDRLRARRW
jgi:GT2 family glycosyltransferase